MELHQLHNAQDTGNIIVNCNFFLLSKFQNNQYQIFVDKVGFDFLDVSI